MTVSRWLVTIVLALASSGVAYADLDEDSVSLYTAPMILEGPSIMSCSIVNVSRQTRTVTILSEASRELAPGQAAVVSFPGGCTDGGCPAYCVFTVQGGKPDFRAAACIYPYTGLQVPAACLPAE